MVLLQLCVTLYLIIVAWCYLENSSGDICKHKRTLLTLYGSFKESFTRFARRDPIMKTTRNIAAH